MQHEVVEILEEWCRGGEEWTMLLRTFGGLARDSAVLEIGCGLGRVAFALRFALGPEGRYRGFEVCRYKVDFEQAAYRGRYPDFEFVWADVYNSYYNPEGSTPAREYRFPYEDASFDVVFAASVFTHMVPENTANYFRESARVLRAGGRCVFSFFLLDFYDPQRPRPLDFAEPYFNFGHPYLDYGDDFSTVVSENPEERTAYRLRLVDRLARDAGLELDRAPLPGLWSGCLAAPIGTQDILIFRKRTAPSSQAPLSANSANALATDSCHIGGDEVARGLRRATLRHETLYGPPGTSSYQRSSPHL